MRPRTCARLGGLSPPGHRICGGSSRLPSPARAQDLYGSHRGGLGIPACLPSLLRSSPPPIPAPRSRDPLAGAGPHGAPCALTETSVRPGARGPLLGESLEAATRRRACNSGAAAGSGGEIRRPRPRRGPSPLPPLLPGPRPPSAPPEGGSAINKRGSVARGPRSCCGSRQIAVSARRVSRQREPPGRAGERARARPQPPPPQLPSAPLPLHGSAAAAAHAALQSGGASRQRIRTLGQGLSGTAASSLTTLHLLRKPRRRRQEGERKSEQKRAGSWALGTAGQYSPEEAAPGAAGRARSGAAGLRRSPRPGGCGEATRCPRPAPRTCPGRCPRLTWLPESPSPSPPLQPERGSEGLEHGWV